MNKRSFKVTVMFSFLVFLILTITMTLMGFLAIALLNLGIIQDPMTGLILLISGVVSVILGTIFSRFAGETAFKGYFLH